jgi:hypothetical protein
MSDTLECKICGAPATVTWSAVQPLYEASLVDAEDGEGKYLVEEEGVIELLRIDCAAGHWYNDTGAEVIV